jgi:probable phosphoglycerate mutase
MLYIMRHGRTDWNVMHKLQGRTDIPLNEDGRRMAERANEEYMDVNFDICYCSPLIRARETAELVLRGRDVPIIIDERLAEMCFGEYEGLETGAPIQSSPLNVLFNNPEKYVASVGGAESLEELYQRTGEFLREMIEPQLSQGKDILIVGHGAMNLSIVCQVKNIRVEKFWSTDIGHCKLMRLV